MGAFIITVAVAALFGHSMRCFLRIKYPELYREMRAEGDEQKRRFTENAARFGTPLAVKLLEILLRR